VRLVVIGCGEWSVIPFYKGARNQYAPENSFASALSHGYGHRPETTGFKGDIYADFSREIFQELGLKVNLQVTPTGEKKKTYLPSSRLANAITSTWVGTAN
jgi:hypothetical protein